MKQNTMIYADYAASAPLRSEARAAMERVAGKTGNPSSLHGFGRELLNELDSARAAVARTLGVTPAEIVFTSGGTEADNLAIRGAMHHFGNGHLITSSIEHKAVLACCQQLEREGFSVSYIDPEASGRINPAHVVAAIRPDTKLVSIMYVNNEIGTIQPIDKIATQLADWHKTTGQRILLHTDAVQAGNLLSLQIPLLKVDLMSWSAHKLGGPKGVGGLFVKSGITLHPTIYGGGQERGLRSGTPNVEGAAGMAMALQLAQLSAAKENARIAQISKLLIDRLTSLEGVTINANNKWRLPSHINISVANRASDELLIACDRLGLAVSAASACSSGSIQPSYVLAALNRTKRAANNTSSLRISLGRLTTKKEGERIAKILTKVITK